jgi:hypothetical protein
MKCLFQSLEQILVIVNIKDYFKLFLCLIILCEMMLKSIIKVKFKIFQASKNAVTLPHRHSEN